MKQSSDDVKKQVAKQDEQNYDDLVTDGSVGSADPFDIDKIIGETYGPDAKKKVEEGLPLNIADELDSDTADLAGSEDKEQPEKEEEAYKPPLKKAA